MESVGVFLFIFLFLLTSFLSLFSFLHEINQLRAQNVEYRRIKVD